MGKSAGQKSLEANAPIMAQNYMTYGTDPLGRNVAQQGQDKLMGNLYGSNQQFQTNYNTGVGMNLGDYSSIMGKYNDFLSNPWGSAVGADGQPIGSGGGGGGGGIGYNDPFGAEYGGYSNLANGGLKYGWDPEFRGALSKAIGGYGNFADTGGFSEQDKQDMRARAIAPTRAIYANALANVERNRNLQQFSPNYNAAMTKMAREQSYGISDANVNANAALAQLIQQGKLAGMAGLTQAGVAGQGQDTNINQLNSSLILAGLGGMSSIDQARLQAQLAASSGNAGLGEQRAEAEMAGRLAAMSGMTNLYGTTPGLANTFGNQLLQSGNQLLQGQGLQNQLTLGQQQNANNLYGITKGSKGNWMQNIAPMINAGLNAYSTFNNSNGGQYSGGSFDTGGQYPGYTGWK